MDAQGRFRDGADIRTSFINKIAYWVGVNETVIETNNSIYRVDGNLLSSSGIEKSEVTGNELVERLADKSLNLGRIYI